MIKLLFWLIVGHCHKWKIIDQRPLNITSHGETIGRGERYVLQCEHCGNIKQRDIR